MNQAGVWECCHQAVQNSFKYCFGFVVFYVYGLTILRSSFEMLSQYHGAIAVMCGQKAPVSTTTALLLPVPMIFPQIHLWVHLWVHLWIHDWVLFLPLDLLLDLPLDLPMDLPLELPVDLPPLHLLLELAIDLPLNLATFFPPSWFIPESSTLSDPVPLFPLFGAVTLSLFRWFEEVGYCWRSLILSDWNSDWAAQFTHRHPRQKHVNSTFSVKMNFKFGYFGCFNFFWVKDWAQMRNLSHFLFQWAARGGFWWSVHQSFCEYFRGVTYTYQYQRLRDTTQVWEKSLTRCFKG